MKKLIPALCLLLVTAMLVGTSTYAWFTMNTAVTAKGMQVKAVAGSGLIIANYDGTNVGSFGNEATAKSYVDDNTFQSLNPTSTINCTDWVYTLASEGSSYEKATSEAYKGVTDASSYYLKNQFVIQTAGGEAIDGNSLYISNITISGNTAEATDALKSNLDKSLRVAVRYTKDWSPSTTGTSEVKFFAPLYAEDALTKRSSTATTGNGCGVKVTTSGGSSSYTVEGLDVYGNTVFGTGKNGIKIESGSVSSKTLVEIFVYYEGEDTNNKTGNTANGVDNVKFEVTFSAVAEEPSVTIAGNMTSGLTATPANLGTKTVSSYAWYKSESTTDPASGGSWETSAMSGKTTATLAAGDLTAGCYYKCVITVDGKTYTSNTLRVVAV